MSVILPTYNEALTLPILIPKISAIFEEFDLRGEIIVVDDDSPDGTAGAATELGLTFPVTVISRTGKRGLATAVMDGFSASRATVCVVMDADGSHPVSALPVMVQTLLEDRADLVVGSRHIPGGGTRDWSIFSQLKSRFAALLAVGVTTMTDPTTGLMALRRNLLPRLKLNPVGWKIVLEIAVKATPVRIAEVPIVFTDRQRGQSKQSLAVFGQYVQHLLQLYAFRFPGLAEFARFCLVGLTGLAVDMGVVIALKQTTTLDTRLCAVVGFCLAVSSNFMFNRLWTFRKRARSPVIASYLAFVASSSVGLAARILVMHGLIELAHMDAGYGYILNNLLGIGCSTIINFIGAKYFVFGRPQESLTHKPSPTEPIARDHSVPVATRHRRAFLAMTLLGLCSAAAFAGHWGDVRIKDERVNLTMARNIAQDARFAVRPSVFPGGRNSWVREDLPHLGNLPLYPVLLAPLDAAWSVRGGLWLAFFSLCVALTGLFRTVKLVSRDAAGISVALLACSPAALSLFSHIEFEPLLVAFGLVGVALVAQGLATGRRVMACAGSACLGLAFLTKMWLVAPFVVSALAWFMGCARAETEHDRRRRIVTAALITLTFIVTASAHLVTIAILEPGDLGAWLRFVYLGLFTGAGVTGMKLSANPESASAWYYPLLLVGNHGHVLLLALLGLPRLTRTTPQALRRGAALFGAPLLTLILLSIPTSREPLYLLPVLPFVYGLGGLGLATILRNDSSEIAANVSMARTVAVLTVLLAICLPWLDLRHGPSELTTSFLLLAATFLVAMTFATRAQWAFRATLGLLGVGAMCGWASALGAT